MANSYFVEQELTRVQNLVIEEKFPQYLAASGAIIDIESPAGKGVEFYKYYLLSKVGQAQILANGSEDIPMVNVDRDTRTGRYYTIANGYEYTQEDLEAAERSQQPLNASLAIAAREIMENEYDSILFFGKDNYDLTGMVDHPNVVSTTVPADGSGSSTQWKDKTADQIYRDLASLAEDMQEDTQYLYSPQILALPVAQFNIISRTPYPNNSDSAETIFTYYLKQQRQNPYGVRRIIPVPRLKGAFSGGVDGMIGFTKAPNLIEGKLAVDFEQMPEERRDLNYRVICRMRSGGSVIYQPLSVRQIDGI